MKIILIGIQGAGKSTQGNMIADTYKIPYLSSGHILREMAKEKTQLGRYIKETLAAGFLVPDDKMIEILQTYLTRPEYKQGYVLDGFPRTVPQAESFSDGVDLAIYLEVSDKEALWRLSGRDDSDREDNTLQALRKRIDSFHQFTKPVIEFYKKHRRLVVIDGEKPIKDIFGQIREHIDNRATK